MRLHMYTLCSICYVLFVIYYISNTMYELFCTIYCSVKWGIGPCKDYMATSVDSAVLFVGAVTIRALLFRSILRPLILGTSHIGPCIRLVLRQNYGWCEVGLRLYKVGFGVGARWLWGWYEVALIHGA